MCEEYTSKENFEKYCQCAFSIYDFVDNIDSNVHWFFKKCYEFDNHKRYNAIFSSYDLPEYKDYYISVEAVFNKNTNLYNVKLISKFEPLLYDNE